MPRAAISHRANERALELCDRHGTHEACWTSSEPTTRIATATVSVIDRDWGRDSVRRAVPSSAGEVLFAAHEKSAGASLQRRDPEAFVA